MFLFDMTYEGDDGDSHYSSGMRNLVRKALAGLGPAELMGIYLDEQTRIELRELIERPDVKLGQDGKVLVRRSKIPEVKSKMLGDLLSKCVSDEEYGKLLGQNKSIADFVKGIPGVHDKAELNYLLATINSWDKAIIVLLPGKIKTLVPKELLNAALEGIGNAVQNALQTHIDNASQGTKTLLESLAFLMEMARDGRLSEERRNTIMAAINLADSIAIQQAVREEIRWKKGFLPWFSKANRDARAAHGILGMDIKRLRRKFNVLRI